MGQETITLQDFINILHDEAQHFDYYWQRRAQYGLTAATTSTIEEWRREFQRWRKEERQGIRVKGGWR